MKPERREDIAFEMLMQSVPNSDHYDSGEDGLCPECRSCRFHRPYWRERSCVFEECPYQPGLITLQKENYKDMKGGDNDEKQETL